MTRANFGIVVVVATGFLSCADPVLSDAVDALGPETSGIPKASTTVQDSRAVHATKKEDLPPKAPFTVAGTVFAQERRQVGVEGVEVRMTDAERTTHIATTNCVGNFMVTPNEWSPRFPILVEVGKGTIRRSMRSPIGRNASCAGCHSTELEVANPFSQVGHVYLYGTDEPGSPEGAADCPVDPKRSGTP